MWAIKVSARLREFDSAASRRNHATDEKVFCHLLFSNMSCIFFCEIMFETRLSLLLFHSPIPMTPPLVANLVMLPFACLTMSPSRKMGHSLKREGGREIIHLDLRRFLSGKPLVAPLGLSARSQGVHIALADHAA